MTSSKDIHIPKMGFGRYPESGFSMTVKSWNKAPF
jgi:hypothetical protein